MEHRRLKFNRISAEYIEVFDFTNDSSEVLLFLDFKRYLQTLNLDAMKVSKIKDKLDSFQVVILDGQSALSIKPKSEQINLFDREEEDDTSFMGQLHTNVLEEYESTISDDIFDMVS